MADKTTRLILDALARAAVEPDGLPVFARKNESGLFPSSSAARSALERARTEGLLAVSELRGIELGRLTEKGMSFLTRQASPKQVLEDLTRALEERQQRVDEMAETLVRMADGLTQLRAVVERVTPRIHDSTTGNGYAVNGTMMAERSAGVDALIADIKGRLSEWHAGRDSTRDCPLPELFRRLESGRKWTIGSFHDALRQLHDDHQIYLHPWTGPLYTLPEPAFALMIGHEVAYYASIR